ncbi:hypothetical protein [Helicobacter sp.]|uniref:hypothetical protein n=1 Tax=Helicobacter sp. TaxID=218 RepID=UPI0019893530|nr:hypothetical protein [Helicobacter sp.]MBD5164980.1 sigma-70 family RNA polymerase sigma factor [Helicobacter sp.]
MIEITKRISKNMENISKSLLEEIKKTLDDIEDYDINIKQSKEGRTIKIQTNLNGKRKNITIIETSSRNTMKDISIRKKEAKRLYKEEHKTQKEIAKILGCSQKTISNDLKE